MAESELAANGRRCELANTGKNSIEVHCVSITILLAFERIRMSLKGEVVRLAMLAQDDHAHRMVS
jgi:hypothetical protein